IFCLSVIQYTSTTLFPYTTLFRSQDAGIYTKLIVARPVVPMGKDIGFLPGEMEDKLRPWMQPIYDNLEFLFNCKNSDELTKLLRSEEHTSELQSRENLVCRLLLAI